MKSGFPYLVFLSNKGLIHHGSILQKELITMFPNPLVDNESFVVRRIVARKDFSAKRIRNDRAYLVPFFMRNSELFLHVNLNKDCCLHVEMSHGAPICGFVGVREKESGGMSY
jgi:hypothetical protein